MSSDINLRSHIHSTYGIGQVQGTIGQNTTLARKNTVSSLAERRADLKQQKNARKEHQEEVKEPRVFELDGNESDELLNDNEENNQIEQPQNPNTNLSNTKVKRYRSTHNLMKSDTKKKETSGNMSAYGDIQTDN